MGMSWGCCGSAECHQGPDMETLCSEDTVSAEWGVTKVPHAGTSWLGDIVAVQGVTRVPNMGTPCSGDVVVARGDQGPRYGNTVLWGALWQCRLSPRSLIWGHHALGMLWQHGVSLRSPMQQCRVSPRSLLQGQPGQVALW